MFAKHFGDGENDVGCRRAGGNLASELEADDLRNKHRHRLTEHGRLGFDTPDSPAKNSKTIDHSGV